MSDNQLDLKIEIPKTWPCGETVSWPIATGLKVRAFVFVKVSPPLDPNDVNDEVPSFVSVDVTHYGDGMYEASFVPTMLGVHKILIEIENKFYKEYSIEITKGKKIGKPKIQGYNFKSLCPGREATCLLVFPDELKVSDYVATFQSKNGTRTIPIVPHKQDYAIQFVPQTSDEKIIISVKSALKNIHIEGSPNVATVGPPNPWFPVTVKMPLNEPTKKEQFCFQINTPAHTEVNDIYIDATVYYFENLNRHAKNKGFTKLECHLSQSEIQKDIQVYDPDEQVEIEDSDEKQNGHDEKKEDLKESKDNKDKEKDKESKQKSSKSKKDKEKDKGKDKEKDKEKPPRPANSPRGNVEKPPVRPTNAPLEKPKGRTGTETSSPENNARNFHSELLASHGNTKLRPVQSTSIKRPVAFNTLVVANLFDENQPAPVRSIPEEKRGQRPTRVAPVSKVQKETMKIDTCIPYEGPMKRWDCYFVAEQEGEVVINIILHGNLVAGGPWRFVVNGESYPFCHGLPWEKFAAQPIAPLESEEHENGFVINSRWQNLTEKATLLSFSACTILDNGKIDEIILEGQKISNSGALEIIPMGKMAGRSARKFIIRPKAFKRDVACVPIFITCTASNFTNVAALSIQTTLMKPNSKMMPLFGLTPSSNSRHDQGFFVGVMFKNKSGIWGLKPVGKFVKDLLISKMIQPYISVVNEYSPNYKTPPSVVVKRAPVSSHVLQLEFTRAGIWDTTLHKNTKQKIISNTVAFTWTNEVHQVVKEGEDFGGIKNDGPTQIISLREISPDVKCILFIDTVKNPIWDAKPMKILQEATVEVTCVSEKEDKIDRKEWGNFTFKGGEKMEEFSSIVEGKLFRNSWTEPWEFLNIIQGATEVEVEDYLGSFSGYSHLNKVVDEKDKSKKKKSVEPVKLSLSQYLPTDWSQKVRHLKCIVLETKNIVPLKAGLTETSLAVELQMDPSFQDKEAYKMNKTDYTTTFSKLQKGCSPFWGKEFYFRDIINHSSVPVCVSVFESHDEKYKDTKLIGTLKLNLLRMFEASVGEGGTVIEQWYKLLPTAEEKAAIKSHGIWWSVNSPVTAGEIKLRFISYS